MVRLLGLIFVAVSLCGCTPVMSRCGDGPGPYIIVLGVGQDGGVPQAGSVAERGWSDPAYRRRVVCLGLVAENGQRWMFEATPDFPSQLRDLCLSVPARPDHPLPDGIFLTHAHIGHYTGLMYLGHEAMGAHEARVYAMPRMRAFLESNGPWSQLVTKNNITLTTLKAGEPVDLGSGLTVTPIEVPHRQEFSEVVGFRIDGPLRRVLFIPDIDSWEQWDSQGSKIEDRIAAVDVAYIDGTFFSGDELPGRDMKQVPHPAITHTMEHLARLPAKERAKVRFIHLNHTNPALWPGAAQDSITRQGFHVAAEGERVRI